MNDNLSKEFLAVLQQIKGKRSQIVIQHILKHGFITTEELESIYGYKHPPRAIRDVREQGVPIETFRIKDSQGRDIAAYRFGDVQNINKTRIGGRKSFKKQTKQHLIEHYGLNCAICHQEYPEQFLQIDHKILYEVAGDTDEADINTLMLVCASCNRSKSWMCEHCDNWVTHKNKDTCENCFWCDPQMYTHIAMKAIRRLEVIWQGDEVISYDTLITHAQQQGISASDYIKKLISALDQNEI